MLKISPLIALKEPIPEIRLPIAPELDAIFAEAFDKLIGATEYKARRPPV